MSCLRHDTIARRKCVYRSGYDRRARHLPEQIAMKSCIEMIYWQRGSYLYAQRSCQEKANKGFVSAAEFLCRRNRRAAGSEV